MIDTTVWDYDDNNLWLCMNGHWPLENVIEAGADSVTKPEGFHFYPLTAHNYNVTILRTMLSFPH